MANDGLLLEPIPKHVDAKALPIATMVAVDAGFEPQLLASHNHATYSPFLSMKNLQ